MTQIHEISQEANFWFHKTLIQEKAIRPKSWHMVQNPQPKEQISNKGYRIWHKQIKTRAILKFWTRIGSWEYCEIHEEIKKDLRKRRDRESLTDKQKQSQAFRVEQKLVYFPPPDNDDTRRVWAPAATLTLSALIDFALFPSPTFPSAPYYRIIVFSSFGVIALRTTLWLVFYTLLLLSYDFLQFTT